MEGASVTSRFSELIIDGHDLRRLAEFWCEVLGYRILEDTPEALEIGAQELTADDVREGAVAPTIVFVPVPEDKAVKNRVHIDVSPIDGTQEEEVERLIGLGAGLVDIGQGKQSWVVMADPEGNEFCVLRSLQP
jgi:catechol 2,3-dioxygenase-like lactoylglutathione lyase family enzyme